MYGALYQTTNLVISLNDARDTHSNIINGIATSAFCSGARGSSNRITGTGKNIVNSDWRRRQYSRKSTLALALLLFVLSHLPVSYGRAA